MVKCVLDSGQDKRHTLLKEKIPEDGIGGHLGVDGDDAAPDNLIPWMGGEQVVDAIVDVIKVMVDLLEPAPLGDVWHTISVEEGPYEQETCRGF